MWTKAVRVDTRGRHSTEFLNGFKVLSKGFGRRVPVMRFSRLGVTCWGHGLDIWLTPLRPFGAVREVSTHKLIGVLVRAALP